MLVKRLVMLVATRLRQLYTNNMAKITCNILFYINNGLSYSMIEDFVHGILKTR
jgi:hypothetical protein